MKATERPGAAQVTATPRSVTALRQMNPPTLQDIREALAGNEQSPFFCQPVTSERPSSQETPVTRTSPPEPMTSQLVDRTPTGAPAHSPPYTFASLSRAKVVGEVA